MATKLPREELFKTANHESPSVLVCHDHVAWIKAFRDVA
jgi:hypothetical protein